jgi:hypothetical protein
VDDNGNIIADVDPTVGLPRQMTTLSTHCHNGTSKSSSSILMCYGYYDTLALLGNIESIHCAHNLLHDQC